MSSIGPELPPHLLARRKRQAEDDAEAAINTAVKRSPSSDGGKRQRVVGPSLPPAPLEERPPIGPADQPDSSDDESDDDYGPALPGQGSLKHDVGRAPHVIEQTSSPDLHASSTSATSSHPPERDAWMMMPPKQDDLAARMDPTKLRARKFNTGKGPHRPGPSSGDDTTLWTETPEQKRKRLADEVLGVAAPKAAAAGGVGSAVAQAGKERSKEDKETARRIREHTEKTRGKSLYTEHQKREMKEKEDDPSQRPFDREKDIVSGTKIGHSQRKEMVSRASDFGSKFAGGGYL